MPRNRSEKDTPETAALRAHLNAFVAYRDAFLGGGNNFDDGVPRPLRDNTPIDEQFNATWMALPHVLRQECTATYHVGKRIRLISALLSCSARPRAEKYLRARRDILRE